MSHAWFLHGTLFVLGFIVGMIYNQVRIYPILKKRSLAFGEEVFEKARDLGRKEGFSMGASIVMNTIMEVEGIEMSEKIVNVLKEKGVGFSKITKTTDQPN